MSPNDRFVYVANYGSETISVISTGSKKVTATIPVSGGPDGLAITSTGTTLYCTAYSSNVLYRISTAEKKITKTFATGSGPEFPAISPDGTSVYVPNYVDGTVTIVSKSKIEPVVNVYGNGPDSILFRPDGQYAYVSGSFYNSDYFVYAIYTPKPYAYNPPIDVNQPIYGEAITPDGATIYLAEINNIDLLDTATNVITGSIFLGETPPFPIQLGSPAVTPDGKFLLVPVNALETSSGAIVPGNYAISINTATNAVTGSFTVGNGPAAIAINHVGTYAYVTNSVDGTVSVIDITSL